MSNLRRRRFLHRHGAAKRPALRTPGQGKRPGTGIMPRSRSWVPLRGWCLQPRGARSRAREREGAPAAAEVRGHGSTHVGGGAIFHAHHLGRYSTMSWTAIHHYCRRVRPVGHVLLEERVGQAKPPVLAPCALARSLVSQVAIVEGHAIERDVARGPVEGPVLGSPCCVRKGCDPSCIPRCLLTPEGARERCSERLREGRRVLHTRRAHDVERVT